MHGQKCLLSVQFDTTYSRITTDKIYCNCYKQFFSGYNSIHFYSSLEIDLNNLSRQTLDRTLVKLSVLYMYSVWSISITWRGIVLRRSQNYDLLCNQLAIYIRKYRSSSE